MKAEPRQIEPDDYDDGPWVDCWSCGGAGVHEGDCDCGDDTCCCLHPTPPTCDVCHGAGGWVARGRAV